MKQWLLGATALAALCVGASPASAATWPGQCPSGTDPRAIGCMVQGIAPGPTDLVAVWQLGQTQRTRAAQLQQLINGGGDIGNQTVLPPGTIVARSLAQRFGDKIYARDYGVKADGVTSDDQALGLALYACSQIGGHLELPQRWGAIRLTGATLTGNATRLVQNCKIVGSGLPSGYVNSPGSFQIESTSVSPFLLGTNWGFDGLVLYWPGQHGATFYPPAFTDDGVHTAGHGAFDNVTIVNAYDGIAQTNYDPIADNTPPPWGDIKFSNVNIFSAHDNFRFNALGDGMTMSGVRFSPGPLLLNCPTLACTGYAGLAASTATGVHITRPRVPGAAGNINANANIVFVGLRTAWLVDSGGTMAEGQINATYDAVGTVLDTSAGGNWYGYGIQFSGVVAGCQTPAVVWGAPNTGNAPCFDLGPTGNVVVSDFLSAGSQGDFIRTLGASVEMRNSQSLSIGSAQDGGDYHQIRIDSTGAPQIVVQNSRFAGINGSAKTHGITTTNTGVPSVFLVQGNRFEYSNDAVNAAFPEGAIVSGNTSFATNAAGGLRSFQQQNSNAIIYNSNHWDQQPLPTVQDCGAGASISGTVNSGFILTGSGTVLTCRFNQPVALYNKCVFTPSNAIAIGAAPSGLPASWTLSFYIGAAPSSQPGINVFYSCPGA